MIFEAANNHDSEDDLSFEASVANNPYYPYNQELFGHDEENTSDLAKDWFSYFFGMHNSQNAIMFTLGEVPIIVLLNPKKWCCFL